MLPELDDALSWLSEDAFDALVDEADEDDEADELRVVTRRIASNYCDTLAHAAASFLRGEAPGEHLPSLAAACRDLHRLAVAAGDHEQIVVLDQLLERYDGFVSSGRGGASFRTFLRRWLHDYAALAGDVAASAASIVQYDLDALPVFQELLKLKGIGPKRLERLYAAGLYDTHAYRDASSSDIASVSGLPLALCEEVVATARAWERHRRRRDVEALSDALDRFERTLRSDVPTTSEERERLVALTSRMARLAALGFDLRATLESRPDAPNRDLESVAG